MPPVKSKLPKGKFGACSSLQSLTDKQSAKQSTTTLLNTQMESSHLGGLQGSQANYQVTYQGTATVNETWIQNTKEDVSGGI